MSLLWLALGLLAGLLVGIFGGLKWGEFLRGKDSWRYWFANLFVLATGMLFAFYGLTQGLGVAWTFGLGLMGGGITGLKYGYGKSVGLWRVADRLTGSDELPRG